MKLALLALGKMVTRWRAEGGWGEDTKELNGK